MGTLAKPAARTARTSALAALTLVAVGLGGCAQPWKRASDWASVAAPSPAATPEPVGAYDAGCLRGAVPLTAGVAVTVTHPERRRHYGHPDLLAFIDELAVRARAAHGVRLRVGDLGQPRGGPMPSAHASHQIGLDVDLEYEFREEGARTVLTRDLRGLDPARFGSAQVDLLRWAARSPRVARIFVNPTVKVRLCKTLEEPLDWLEKLRPWPGHDDHFHVRLHCPSGAALCHEQPAPPWGSGCFEAQEAQRRLLAVTRIAARPQTPSPTPSEGASAPSVPGKPAPAREFALPDACEDVLREP